MWQFILVQNQRRWFYVVILKMHHRTRGLEICSTQFWRPSCLVPSHWAFQWSSFEKYCGEGSASPFTWGGAEVPFKFCSGGLTWALFSLSIFCVSLVMAVYESFLLTNSILASVLLRYTHRRMRPQRRGPPKVSSQVGDLRFYTCWWKNY